MTKTVKILLGVAAAGVAIGLIWKFTKKPSTEKKEEAASSASGVAPRKYKHKITSPAGCRERGGIPDGVGGCSFPNN